MSKQKPKAKGEDDGKLQKTLTEIFTPREKPKTNSKISTK